MEENEGFFINLELPKGFVFEYFFFDEQENCRRIIIDETVLSDFRIFQYQGYSQVVHLQNVFCKIVI